LLYMHDKSKLKYGLIINNNGKIQMNIVIGELELFQDEVKIKHITLELIMEYVNRLSSTRRVHRNFEWTSPQIRKQFLFEEEAYGTEGMFYWRDDLQETYYNINDRGCMPSLILPFYIEKEDDRYFLRVQEYPKGNDGDSLKSWLRFLHETLFYPAGVYSVGSFEIENSDFNQKHSLTFSKEGIRRSEPPHRFVSVNDLAEEDFYYPIIFDYISKFIEINGLETFDFDEKNYKWGKKPRYPDNSYLMTLEFKKRTLDYVDPEEFEDFYEGVIYQPELTRILFCEEDIAEIDEEYLNTESVGEYHDIIQLIIDDMDDPQILIAQFNLKKAFAKGSEEAGLYQNAFYKRNEDGTTYNYNDVDIDMDILKELGYSVDDNDKLLEELRCSVVMSGIRFLDYKLYKCRQENGISISGWDKY